MSISITIDGAQDDYQRLMYNKSPKNKRRYRENAYLCGIIRTINRNLNLIYIQFIDRI